MSALITNQVDTDWLALVPILIPMLDEADRLWAKAGVAYDIALNDANDAGVELGLPEAESLSSWQNYLRLNEPANALFNEIVDLVDPLMSKPATTLDGLLFKARIAASLEQYEGDAAHDVTTLMRKRFGLERSTDDPEAASEPPEAPAMPPSGYVPCLDGTHDYAYGLKIDANGAGLHMPPGSSVIVEPVPPAPRDFAVAYFKNNPSPSVWHIGDSFTPNVLTYHPDSNVFPLIELFDPITGRRSYKDCRSFEKLHRVQGVYTPVEVRKEFGAPPEALPIISADAVAEGCLEHEIKCASNYPVLREGDVALVDTTKTDLVHGRLCLIRFGSHSLSIAQTNFRKMGSGDPVWVVDPINRPRSGSMLEVLKARGGPLYASDGPYTHDLLQSKVIGTIVGIRDMERRVALTGRGVA